MKTAALALVALTAFSYNVRGQIINTIPAWNGTTVAAPFGEPGYATIGEVFTVDPNFTHLDGLLFGVSNTGTTPLSFGVYIAPWDQVDFHAASPLLYSSSPFTLAGGTGISPIVVTPGLDLVGGNQYVAFLSETPFFDGTPDTGGIAFIGSDVYAGGGTVFINNGSDASLLSSSAWSATTADLAFVAAFSRSASAVPEPSTYGLFGIGMILAVVGLKKRAHRTQLLVRSA